MIVKKGRNILIPLCALLVFISVAVAQEKKSAGENENEMEFDEPGSEQVLNRQLWEFAKGTSYESVEAYVAKQQAKSRVSQSDEMELPTGWRINPAGKQIQVGRLPYEAIFYNGKLVVLNDGYYSNEPQEASVVDPVSNEVASVIKLNSIFPSAIEGADGDLYISGGFD